jgi:hypothetical protein
MSCYVCDDKTFLKVLKAWTRQGEALRPLPTDDELEKAWTEIVGLNYDAWNERYPNDKMEPTEDELKCPVAAGQLMMLNFNKKELYDALKEYMYQVCDADGYEHREGYYKCRWCLDTMLRNYINDEFGEED